jgi:phenol 2-monooxygenase
VGRTRNITLLRIPRSSQALIKTNMPSPRSLNSVQSADHGLLLWCPIDGGRTRIGYVFSEKLQQKWGTVDGQNVSEEAIMEEARKAMEPFTLEFEKVDWFTIYVGGTVASWTFAIAPFRAVER